MNIIGILTMHHHSYKLNIVTIDIPDYSVWTVHRGERPHPESLPQTSEADPTPQQYQHHIRYRPCYESGNAQQDTKTQKSIFIILVI